MIFRGEDDEAALRKIIDQRSDDLIDAALQEGDLHRVGVLRHGRRRAAIGAIREANREISGRQHEDDDEAEDIEKFWPGKIKDRNILHANRLSS